ncbi:hypothetical protein D1872_239410 [compost metagenome]
MFHQGSGQSGRKNGYVGHLGHFEAEGAALVFRLRVFPGDRRTDERCVPDGDIESARRQRKIDRLVAARLFLI